MSASLVKFTAKNFIPVDAIVNGVVFLILCLDVSFLVYRRETEFCVLILCPVILQNLPLTVVCVCV